ncbi:hypothetical protein HU200_021023 [Digitaria exilis]|uniref:Uncharacterized protein n=1 Tax=Digitaria exilis TaxID=1010633 RepID=A0A835KFC2_9POAL|nr:hypothetical protein HU200_021023 [Digitaria exilis]
MFTTPQHKAALLQVDDGEETGEGVWAAPLVPNYQSKSTTLWVGFGFGWERCVAVDRRFQTTRALAFIRAAGAAPLPSIYLSLRTKRKQQRRERVRVEEIIEMSDWGPVVVAVVLFVLLSPGLLLQLLAKGGRFVEFGNFQTSGASIFVHAIIFFALAAVFVIAIGVHITTD